MVKNESCHSNQKTWLKIDHLKSLQKAISGEMKIVIQ